MSSRTLGAVVISTGAEWIEHLMVWRSERLMTKATGLANWVELRRSRRRAQARQRQREIERAERARSEEGEAAE